jgi:hypothetical protein
MNDKITMKLQFLLIPIFLIFTAQFVIAQERFVSFDEPKEYEIGGIQAVSYTHLTLPTKA